MEEKLPQDVLKAIFTISDWCSKRSSNVEEQTEACSTCPLRNRNTDETCGLTDEEVQWWRANLQNLEEKEGE